jgi:hypothetical protein
LTPQLPLPEKFPCDWTQTVKFLKGVDSFSIGNFGRGPHYFL